MITYRYVDVIIQSFIALLFLQVIRTIGVQSRSLASVRSSQINSDAPTPVQSKGNINDIEMLDKILTSLLGLKDNKRRAFHSHRVTPRASKLYGNNDVANRRSESWPDRIFEDSVVRSVMNSLRSNKRISSEDQFLTPK